MTEASLGVASSTSGLDHGSTLAASTHGALPLPGYIRLAVALRAHRDARLPGWTGSLLHGALGHALRRVDDVESFEQSSSYRAWMEAREASSLDVAGLRPAPALVLCPPRVASPTRNVGLGEVLEFDLVALRRGPTEVASLLEALARIGECGLGADHVRFDTVAIRCGGVELLSAGQLVDLPAIERADPASAVPVAPIGLTLSLNTPTTLRREGTLLQAPHLVDLVLASARRLASVGATWGEGSPIPHLGALAERAAAPWAVSEEVWRCFDARRWSSRQQRRHAVSGVMGHARYRPSSQADATEASLAPRLLYRAAVVGIGKGTSLGLGAFTVFADSET